MTAKLPKFKLGTGNEEYDAKALDIVTSWLGRDIKSQHEAQLVNNISYSYIAEYFDGHAHGYEEGYKTAGSAIERSIKTLVKRHATEMHVGDNFVEVEKE